MSDEFGVGWLAAVLVPWAVAPHPNFPQQEIDPFAELALVTEMRAREFVADKYSSEQQLGWPREVTQAALLSTATETQEAACVSLWDLAFRPEIAWGARAAAALYGSLALGELERSATAAQRLTLLSREFIAGRSPDQASPPERLIVAAVLQQLTLRLIDSSQYTEARRQNSLAREWVPSSPRGWGDDFPTSQGIGWKASRVQRDIAESLGRTSLSTKAYLEQLQGQTWVTVIRQRQGWPEWRQLVKSSDRDQEVVRDDFEMKFESTSGKQVFGRPPYSAKGYEALLLAELSGAEGRVFGAREALARIHFLRGMGDAFAVAEGIRLFRHAHAKSSLQPVLSWIRSEGPTAALVADATRVVVRSSEDRYATDADLMVLEYAADFLSDSLLRAGLEACVVYGSTERATLRADWSVGDTVWKTTARLLPGSGMDDLIARRALAALVDERLATPVISTLGGVIAAIDWGKVPSSTTADWANWATQSGSDEYDDLRDDVLARLRPSTDRWDRYSGLALAARLADAEDAKPARSIMDAAREAIVGALAGEAEAAHRGQYSFGGLVPLNVAVAFALRYRDRAVWTAATRHLIDMQINTAMKQAALDRLARQSRQVPRTVVDDLRQAWPEMLGAAEFGPFMSGPILSINPHGLRAGAALKFLPSDLAVQSVIALAAEGDAGRLEAAKSIPFVVGSSDPTWGLALLLEYTYDANPMVRSEACFALAQIASKSPLADTVESRLLVLMKSDGVRVPANTLNGLTLSVLNGRTLSPAFVQAALALTGEDTPRLVRRIARDLLAAIEQIAGKEGA